MVDEPDVIVVGGGVAGLSVAQELMERRFTVHVYERRDVFGGKARSWDVQDPQTQHRYPAEHGFRFFPRFYRHLIDTMSRIPFGSEVWPPIFRRSVRDNLMECSEALLTWSGHPEFRFGTWFPRSWSDWRQLIETAREVNGLGLDDGEIRLFMQRVWQLMTSCDQREANDYERISWWEFVEAKGKSNEYQNFLVGGITRNLVAAKPKVASARVGGKIFSELMFGLMRPGKSNDRVLCGPTAEVWIKPWCDYLTASRLVTLHKNAAVTGFTCKDGRIDSVRVVVDGQPSLRRARYYVLSVPVERAWALIKRGVFELDHTLDVINRLSKDAQRMAGIQFYLRNRLDVAQGHVSYVDSMWALTSICQAQFWSTDLKGYGGGRLKDVLSVDISDFETEGRFVKKPANLCTPDEIKTEVWEQLKKSLNGRQEVLRDDDLMYWHLCSNCTSPGSDEDRLLVNTKNSWWKRPEAYTRIPNFFLASDYVRTNTSLATMEAANEAARRAVNAILDLARSERVAGRDFSHCQIWTLYRPRVLARFRNRDARRYAAGQPWDEAKVDGAYRVAYHAAVWLSRCLGISGRQIERAIPRKLRRARRRALALASPDATQARPL